MVGTGVRLPGGHLGGDQPPSRIMADSLYADVEHVVEALERAREDGEFDDPVRVSVYASDAVMRGITLDEVQDRNLDGYLGEHLCTFEYDGTRLALSFHQSVIDGSFRLAPADVGALPPVEQATGPKALSSDVAHVLRAIEDEWDITCYDFTEVSAGSMASGGHFTDFEFEYVVTTTDF